MSSFWDIAPGLDLEQILYFFMDAFRDVLSTIGFFTLLSGIWNCYFGYRLFRISMAISGFLVGGIIGFALGGLMTEFDSIGVILICALVCGVLGAWLSYKLYRLGVFFLMLLISFPIGWLVFGSLPIGLVLGILLGIVGFISVRPVVIISTACSGATVCALGMSLLLVKPETGFYYLWLLAFAASGLIVQWKYTGRDRAPVAPAPMPAPAMAATAAAVAPALAPVPASSPAPDPVSAPASTSSVSGEALTNALSHGVETAQSAMQSAGTFLQNTAVPAAKQATNRLAEWLRPQSYARCGVCAALNSPDAKYCTACGRQIDVQTACPSCHAVITQSGAFCGRCGTPLGDILVAQPSTVRLFNLWEIPRKTLLIGLAAVVVFMLFGIALTDKDEKPHAKVRAPYASSSSQAPNASIGNHSAAQRAYDAENWLEALRLYDELYMQAGLLDDLLQIERCYFNDSNPEGFVNYVNNLQMIGKIDLSDGLYDKLQDIRAYGPDHQTMMYYYYNGGTGFMEVLWPQGQPGMGGSDQPLTNQNDRFEDGLSNFAKQFG